MAPAVSTAESPSSGLGAGVHPASSAAGPKHHSPFAYQTRVLERSSSIRSFVGTSPTPGGSTNGNAINSSPSPMTLNRGHGASASIDTLGSGASGLGSIRRYHRTGLNRGTAAGTGSASVDLRPSASSAGASWKDQLSAGNSSPAPTFSTYERSSAVAPGAASPYGGSALSSHTASTATSSGGTYSSAYTAASSISVANSSSSSSSAAAAASKRFSAPPSPSKYNSNGAFYASYLPSASSTSNSPNASGARPGSPTKFASSHYASSYSPTPASSSSSGSTSRPLGDAGASVNVSNNLGNSYVPSPLSSPTAKDNAAYGQAHAAGGQRDSAAPASFWSTNPSTEEGGAGADAAGKPSAAAAAPHLPAQLHLGGVSELKRSSVGALKIMRDFTTRAGVSSATSSPAGAAAAAENHGDAAHPRMIVRGAAATASTRTPTSPKKDAYSSHLDTPTRPGRMQSEDQGDGEIVLPGITTGAEDVQGLAGRIRLVKQPALGHATGGVSPSAAADAWHAPSTPATGGGAAPYAGGSFASSTAGLPGTPTSPVQRQSAALGALPFSSNSKWMDTQRHLLQAYEYLCHCGEAKEWMEHHVGEVLAASVVEMEESMRNGIFLAKLARVFEPSCVPKIFAHPKLQYKHTDNVNYFFRAVAQIGLPAFFHFELTDLYEKKNFPKVVYCVHALSHILARQGRARKVGNLVGKLEFTDDQLQQTQRGLDAAGVSMPQFGALGSKLAKEMNVEPEPEPETEQQRIDRELAEHLAAITLLQAAARAHLARRAFAQRQAAEQRRRAELARLRAEAEERRRQEEERRKAEEDERTINAWTPRVQAQLRGALVRTAFKQKQQALHATASHAQYTRLQALCRGALARKSHFHTQQKVSAGVAQRWLFDPRCQTLCSHSHPVLSLSTRPYGCLGPDLQMTAFSQQHATGIAGIQAQCRGVLARRRYESLIFQLGDSIEDVIKLQSALRAVLARRRLLSLIRGLRGSSDSTIELQAQVRGYLARRSHKQMSHALQKVEVTKAVGGLQSFARAALARRKHQEQRKQLDFVTPDVVGVQAQIRGILARQEYEWWRAHLIQSEPVAVHLQSLLRGALARRAYWSKLRHYHEHMDKIVKIQSLFRGKQQGQQYRSLTVGKNVPVSTIKNFGHLLNDSDADFEDEIEVERLRKLVVRGIRENQTLDNDVQELDTKIALLVKNKIGIEELVRVKNERGLLGPPTPANLQRRNSLLVAAKDPFAEGQTLDRDARHKLELYQELFFMLQTRPEYLARLFARVGKLEMSDRYKKQVEKVVLTLFGYAQNLREEYLLLKLFQRCVAEELGMVNTVQEFIRGNAQFIKLVVQYNRGAKERQYLRDLLGPLVQGIMRDDALDLETDPCAIYRQAINIEESQTGMPSRKPLDVSFDVALNDPLGRTIFIRHLQALRATTDAFLSAIINSTGKMPFGIRYIAREVFRALQSKFPQEPEGALIKVVGHLVYYRYLNPAIVAPEGFDVIETLVGPIQRKNLAEVSKMLTQIAVGRLFSDDNPYLQPLNEYVAQASARFTAWLQAVVDVPDAEMQFSAEQFVEQALNDTPVIYISPNEIYALQQLLNQQLETVAPAQSDPIRRLLSEIGAPPSSASADLNVARDSEITLELVGRKTALQDPEAESKALFVETKRLVLSVLKVQSGQTLYKVLLEPVTDQDELSWEEIVSLEIAADRARQRGQRPPPSANHFAPRLQDVRKLSFVDLKAHTLQNMLKLEQLGKVSRENEFQDMLNAIAIDIRNKHRKRIQRANEKAAMHVTLTNLQEKHAYLEEQITSYNNYIDASMQTMQKKG